MLTSLFDQVCSPLLLRALVCAVLATNSVLVQAAPCAFEYWFTFRDTKVFKTADQTAYLFRTSYIAIDADGAPNAYGPNDTGLDINKHAGYPTESWWPNVLVPDPANPTKAYQQPSGPYKGLFVSQTHLRNPKGAITDPASYVDARIIPYIVFPTGFVDVNGKGSTGYMGDFGAARSADGKLTSGAIVADSGGGATPPLGEVSIALAEALGGKNVNPRNGAGQPKGPFTYIVFPNSRSNLIWPLTLEQVESRSAALMARLGGWKVVDQCKFK